MASRLAAIVDLYSRFVVALLALVWVLTPAIAFGLGFVRVRVKAWPDPAAVEPTPDDPDYQQLFQQFVALGFRPAGKSSESCWFINPVKWRWESFGLLLIPAARRVFQLADLTPAAVAIAALFGLAPVTLIELAKLARRVRSQNLTPTKTSGA